MINTILEKNWGISDIPNALCHQEISSVESILVGYVLSLLGINNTIDDTWQLDFQKVAKATANIMFRKKRKELLQIEERLNVNQFSSTMKDTGTSTRVELNNKAKNGLPVTWEYGDFMLSWGTHTPVTHGAQLTRDLLQVCAKQLQYS